MLVSESITKIRRLVRDAGSIRWTDAQILLIWDRIQQEFCRETECFMDIRLVKAPPHLDYAYSFAWEEGQYDFGAITGETNSMTGGFFLFFKTASYVATQPWELETGYAQTSSGGYTASGGVELGHIDNQLPIPFPLPRFNETTVYSIKALIWDNKWAEQKSQKWLESFLGDGRTKRGDVVDYFATLDSMRQKGFVAYGAPYAIQSSGTNFASQKGEELLTDVF